MDSSTSEVDFETEEALFEYEFEAVEDSVLEAVNSDRVEDNVFAILKETECESLLVAIAVEVADAEGDTDCGGGESGFGCCFRRSPHRVGELY